MRFPQDTRPRIKYVLPDGRPITVIGAHGRAPEFHFAFQLAPSDPLWPVAQASAGGSDRRFVYATLAQGL